VHISSDYRLSYVGRPSDRVKVLIALKMWTLLDPYSESFCLLIYAIAALLPLQQIINYLHSYLRVIVKKYLDVFISYVSKALPEHLETALLNLPPLFAYQLFRVHYVEVHTVGLQAELVVEFLEKVLVCGISVK